jgi:hypothetical protein
LARIIATLHIRATTAPRLLTVLSLLSSKPKARHTRVNSADKFHHAVVSGFVGSKDKGKRLGCHIFTLLGKSLLDNMTEYGLHSSSFAELIILRQLAG